MADSDVIGGIENLTDAVSGETPSYEYKNPNTDMMKAISKCVDAATGETGTEYEYDNPNTDVIQKMEELATAIASSSGGGFSFDNVSIYSGKINLETGSVEADENFYYTDLFNAPDGRFTFNLGETSDSKYIGIEMCGNDGSHKDYYTSYSLYREVDHHPYYSTAPKLRLSFHESCLNKVIVFDKINNVFFVANPIVIGNKD